MSDRKQRLAQELRQPVLKEGILEETRLSCDHAKGSPGLVGGNSRHLYQTNRSVQPGERSFQCLSTGKIRSQKMPRLTPIIAHRASEAMLLYSDPTL